MGAGSPADLLSCWVKRWNGLVDSVGRGGAGGMPDGAEVEDDAEDTFSAAEACIFLRKGFFVSTSAGGLTTGGVGATVLGGDGTEKLEAGGLWVGNSWLVDGVG